ncbi:MAG: hypothetical protein VXZ96_03885 [Myxococcota bacterium]|nr:hypothetical protein [Myxococcota bacterium]
MLNNNPHVRRLLALGVGILLFLGIEILFRVLGIAAGSSYAPPRLIQVVENGQIQGELVQQSTPYFEVINDKQVQTASVYREGNGDGFPASGSMRQVRFNKNPTKPRYFILGGSAALGQNPVNLKIERTWKTVPLGKQVRALDEPLSISGQVRLALAKKGQGAEVINIGMIAQDSGGVRRIALETLRFSPKALLLYMGNNEGIGLSFGMQGEELPIVPEVRSMLYDLRTFRLLSDWIQPMRQRQSQQLPPLKGTKPEVLGRLTQTQWRAAGSALMAESGPTDSVYQALLNRFEQNLRDIVEAANAQNTQVVILPTVPHLGYPPFYDANNPALLESEIQTYTQLLGSAKQQLEQQKWSAAEKTLKSALEIDQTHATAWFWLAQSLDEQGRFTEMLNAARHAHLLDISRKRSLPDYFNVAKTVCDELGCIADNAMPSLEKLLKAYGLQVYDRLYGDHEHLTPEGCAWIGQRFAAHL